MRYINYILQILAALYLAQYASFYVIRGQHLYILVLFAGSALFLFSTWKQRFIFFFLIIFFPLQFPRYFPLPVRTFVDLLAPVLCILSAGELLKKGRSLFSSKAFLYFAAIAVLSLWAIVNYIQNPVLGRSIGAGATGGGLRQYTQIFTGITTFLCSYWFFMHNEFNAKRWLFVAMIFCLIIGNMHMFALFTKIPFLDSFSLGSYHVTGEFQHQSIPLRKMFALGLTLIFSLMHTHRLGMYNFIIFLNVIGFMLLGGGRGSLAGLVATVFVYFSLINKKYFLPVMVALLIFTGVYAVFLTNFTISEEKYGRAFKIEGGIKEQSEERYYKDLYMFEVFTKSPIFGKGIGYQEVRSDEVFFDVYPEAIEYIEYIEDQIMYGGHGTYFSIICIFGIGGLFWFSTMLFGSIIYLYRFIKKRGKFHKDTAIAVFAFLQLIAMSIAFVAGGGGGWTTMTLWFLAGITAGLISKDYTQDNIELNNSQRIDL